MIDLLLVIILLYYEIKGLKMYLKKLKFIDFNYLTGRCFILEGFTLIMVKTVFVNRLLH